jgi:serine/threonine protein kinase
VFKVVSELDYQTYALKEVYLKHIDPDIKSAYINEIRLLKRLSDKPEIVTLYH